MLEELSMMYGTMVSFDVLMQGFYIISQNKDKMIPVYVSSLECLLSQIKLYAWGS